MFEFLEFFAGGGMVRAGLGSDNWRCRFANDFDHKKSAVYRANWGDAALRTADIKNLSSKDIDAEVDLAWASFPCRTCRLPAVVPASKATAREHFGPFRGIISS